MLEAFGALALDTFLLKLLGLLCDRIRNPHKLHASLLAPSFVSFNLKDLSVILFESLHLVSLLKLTVRADVSAVFLLIDHVL